MRVDSNAHEPTLEARENTRNSINPRLSPYFSSCWCAHFRMKTVPVCTALPRAFSRKCAVACASFRLFPILLRFFPFLKGSDAPHSSFFCTSSLVKKSERSGASGILFTSSVVVSDRKGFFFLALAWAVLTRRLSGQRNKWTQGVRGHSLRQLHIKRTYLTRSVVFIFIFTFILNVHLEVLGDSEVSGAVSPYIPLAVSLVDQPFESTFFFDLT